MPYASTLVRSLWAGVLVWACLVVGSQGQDRLRFGTPVNTALQTPAATPPALPAMPPTGAVVPPSTGAQAPTATLGQGITPWDPYSTVPPTGPPAYGGTAPYSGAPSYGGTPYPGAPTLPPSTVPAVPPAGSFPAGPPAMYPQTQPLYPAAPNCGQPPPYMRLLEHTGFEYTWLPKMNDDDLQINDFDFFTTLNFPNFLFSPAPLKTKFGFMLHLWDGPRPPAIPVTHPGLPSQAYTGYIDFGWAPRITPQLGVDLHFRPRIGTDFNTVSTDSVRLAGSGAALIWITPAVAIKGGVDYINRARVKLLPIVGIYWKPNEQTDFDITFPSPRLAKYLTTMGNTNVWWYVGGEYGGGTWTLELPVLPGPGSFSSLVDINDIRIFGGFEFTSYRGVKSFIELGYVWDRQIFYAADQSLNYKPQDTLMLRAGIAM